MPPGITIASERICVDGPFWAVTTSKLPAMGGRGVASAGGSNVPLLMNQLPDPAVVIVQPLKLPDSKPPLVMSCTGAGGGAGVWLAVPTAPCWSVTVTVTG